MTDLFDTSDSQAKTLCGPNPVEQSSHFDGLPLREYQSSRFPPGRWSVGCEIARLPRKRTVSGSCWFFHQARGGWPSMNRRYLILERRPRWEEHSGESRSSAGAVSRPIGWWEA